MIEKIDLLPIYEPWILFDLSNDDEGKITANRYSKPTVKLR